MAGRDCRGKAPPRPGGGPEVAALFPEGSSGRMSRCCSNDMDAAGHISARWAIATEGTGSRSCSPRTGRTSLRIAGGVPPMRRSHGHREPPADRSRSPPSSRRQFRAAFEDIRARADADARGDDASMGLNEAPIVRAATAIQPAAGRADSNGRRRRFAGTAAMSRSPETQHPRSCWSWTASCMHRTSMAAGSASDPLGEQLEMDITVTYSDWGRLRRPLHPRTPGPSLIAPPRPRTPANSIHVGRETHSDESRAPAATGRERSFTCLYVSEW